jgi:hypothetical protein
MADSEVALNRWFRCVGCGQPVGGCCLRAYIGVAWPRIVERGERVVKRRAIDGFLLPRGIAALMPRRCR